MYLYSSGVRSGREKSVKKESGTPKVAAPSPSSTLAKPKRGLQITNVRGSLKKQDDEEDSFSSPPVSPQPIPIPIYFEDDDDDEMLAMPKLKPISRVPLPVKQEVYEEEEADDSSSSDVLEDVHEHDTTKRSKFFFCTCGMRYRSKKILGTHIKQKTEKWSFQCTICSKLFFYNSGLKAHMEKFHPTLEAGLAKDKEIKDAEFGSKFQRFSDLQSQRKEEQ